MWFNLIQSITLISFMTTRSFNGVQRFVIITGFVVYIYNSLKVVFIINTKFKHTLIYRWIIIGKEER